MDPPTSSSLAEEKAPLLPPPQHGGRAILDARSLRWSPSVRVRQPSEGLRVGFKSAMRSRTREVGPPGGIEQYRGGNLESLDAAE
jgi:hypothetical protein